MLADGEESGRGALATEPTATASSVEKADGTSRTTDEPDERGACPEGTTRGWLAVVGTFLATVATWGMLDSAGLVAAHWETEQLRGFDGQDVAWVGATTLCLALLVPVVAGPVVDAHGPRWVLAAGSALQVVGLFAASCVSGDGSGRDGERDGGALAGLVLAWGVCCGAGCGLVAVAATGSLCQWFDRRRGLACGAAYLGAPLGGVLLSLLLRVGLARWGWAGTVRLLAAVVAALLLATNLLVRPRFRPRRRPRHWLSWRCFRRGDFSWSVAGLAILQFVIMGVFGTIPAWAMQEGFSKDAIYNAVAIINGGSCVSRLVVGAGCDHVGRINSMLLVQVLLAVALFGLMLNAAGEPWRLYAFAALWGFGTGAVFLLVDVVVGQLCGINELGHYYGTTYMVLSFAALLCMPLCARMLHACGTDGQVILLGALVGLSVICFALARWTHLGRRWSWTKRV